jgi:predicted SnoaL-like aldol condensation-catalyzing enzyme
MKRMYVLIPSMVFLLAGVFVSAQPSEETKRSEAVRTLLKAFENKDQTALDVISPKQYTQHNARVADGREGFTALLNGVPSETTLRIVRIFADGDYVVAQSEYNLSGRKVAFDVFRFAGSQIVAHWDAGRALDVLETIPLRRSGRIPTASCRPYTPPSVFK